MIRVIIDHYTYQYAASDVLRMFCRNILVRSDIEIVGDSHYNALITSVVVDQKVSTRSDQYRGPEWNELCQDDKQIKREIKRQLYYVLTQITQVSFPWGALTGIRPTLVAREVKNAKELSDRYFVQEDKAQLAVTTAKNEDEIMSGIPSDMLSLYIGVPFCPSRCRYCSFISTDMTKQGNLFLHQYVDALIQEIELLSDIIHNVQTIYIGGGTPTILDETQLFRLLDAVAHHTLRGRIREYTIEAGRPETVTLKKLQIIKDFGVNRVCINPQTMSDETLKRIGRKHSVQNFYDAYELARSLDFDCINTDIIAGLPGETYEIFKNTIDGIMSLRPENITIHTLYKKRAAQMEKSEVLSAQPIHSVDLMHSYARSRLEKELYAPYYLYKQKDTIGGHENVGYNLPGKSNIYNVAMMSDRFSVLAVGAGGISKRVFAGNRLERCHCVRDPNIYISRVQELAKKKTNFFEINEMKTERINKDEVSKM